MWWCTPIISELGKLKQEYCEFQASLGYIASSRSALPTEEDLLKKEKEERKKQH
jgi:hypothetical protein